MADTPPTVRAKNYGQFHGVNKTDLAAFAKWHREHATAELLAAMKARFELHADALKLVEQLALDWTAEGTRGDEPGSAKEAFELLVKHGYTLSSTRTLLYRPDGSEVVR